MSTEKPVHWIGSSKRDFLAFPDPVKGEMEFALGVAQLGSKHPKAKPWRGEGPGVFELDESFDGNAYCAVDTVRFEGVFYVPRLPEKGPSGIRTAAVDIELVTSRLKLARLDHEKSR